jgi:hypothetical protein
MSRVVLLSITLAVCAGLGHGQTEDPTGDGYWWETLQPDGKLGFVGGYAQGAADMEVTILNQLPAACKQRVNATGFWTRNRTITVDQVVDSVNHFYTDYRNESMGVDSAIAYARRELDGASPEQLEQYRRYLQASESYRTKDVPHDR